MHASISSPAALAQRSRSWVAQRLFDFLHAESVRYCVVGSSDAFPEQIPSDIDMVVDHAALTSIPEVLQRFCSQHDLSLVQFLRHDQLHATFYVLAWLDGEGRWQFLQPDFGADYVHRGSVILTAQEILATRRFRPTTNASASGHYVAAPAIEFIYYCHKKVVWKQNLNDVEADHLSHQWRRDPTGALAQLRRLWHDDTLVQTLARAAQDNRWDEVRAAFPRFAAALARSALLSSWSAPAELARRISRVLRPTGLFVAFLGPDGSGKTRISAEILPYLQPAFRRTAYFHWRPHLFSHPNDPGGTAEEPHAEALRGWFNSSFKLVYLALCFGLGYLWRIRPLLVRSTLVVFDRYFHDLVVDPRRYRYGGSVKLAKLAARLIPKPDMWILLDAPTKVLRARKQEVSLGETERQRSDYRRLVELLPSSVIIDSSAPAEKVVIDVAGSILGFLAKRTARRFDFSRKTMGST